MSQPDFISENPEIVKTLRKKPKVGVLSPISKPNHWIFRVSNGTHFINSSVYYTWGVNSEISNVKHFIANARNGDILWFVTCKSKGHIIAVATYDKIVDRIIGPIINISLTNEELGWTLNEGNWDKEVKYNKLYNIGTLELKTEIQAPHTVRIYNSESCKVDLPEEYARIIRYSTITQQMK
jgi:hypothetical protein